MARSRRDCVTRVGCRTWGAGGDGSGCSALSRLTFTYGYSLVARCSPLSVEFQEWLPFPLGHLGPGIEPMSLASLALQVFFTISVASGKPQSPRMVVSYWGSTPESMPTGPTHTCSSICPAEALR